MRKPKDRGSPDSIKARLLNLARTRATEFNQVLSRYAKEDDEYMGGRLTLVGVLGNARIPIQIDVGFGDAVVPPPKLERFPVLLDLPAPELATYPKEAVIAEKFHALVTRGLSNSRMKDIFDLWFLAGHFEFRAKTLVAALRATFERRSIDLPREDPIAFTEQFWSNPDKLAQWRSFIARTDAHGVDLQSALERVAQFLRPLLKDGLPVASVWSSDTGWR